MASRPVWNKVGSFGNFKGHPGGEFSLTPNTFAECVRNFNRDGIHVVVDHEHASELSAADSPAKGRGEVKAAGWVTALEARADGLYAAIEWLDDTRAGILSGAWKYLSPAIRLSAKDPKTGADVGAKLSSLAVVLKPFLRDLPPIRADDSSVAFLCHEISDAEIASIAASDAPPTAARRFAHPADKIAHERALERAAERERAAAAKIESARNDEAVRRIMAELQTTPPTVQQRPIPTMQTPSINLSFSETVKALQLSDPTLSFDEAWELAAKTKRITYAMADGAAGGASTQPTPATPAVIAKVKAEMQALRDADRDFAMQQARYNAPRPPIPAPGNFYRTALQVASTDPTLSRDQIDEMLRKAQIKDAEVTQARADATLNQPLRPFPGTPVTA